MNPHPNEADARQFPAGMSRAAIDAWCEHEANDIAEHLVDTDDWSTLIGDHDEWALLDLLLDAVRYGADTKQAFEDLRGALIAGEAKRIAEALKTGRQ